MYNISPVIRITIGLLLLTISLLLIGDMLGFVPNQDQSKISARKIMSESFAIQISSEIGEGRVENAKALLNIIVSRNEDITSMGLRSKSKNMIMETDSHEQFWIQRDDDSSTISNVQVPIFNQKERWGTLEISFKTFGGFWSNLVNGSSFITMILFIVVFGFLGYWLFLKRVLSELDPGSVVPDRVRSALDILSEGLVILDTSERILFINDSFKKKIGLPEGKLIGRSLSSLAWEREEIKFSAEKKKMPWSILFETTEIPPLENLKFTTANDELLTFDINISPIYTPDQKIKGAVVTIDDITELEKKNKELTYILQRLEKSQEEINRQNIELVKLATRDPLTDLLNRRALFEGFNSLLNETRTQGGVVGCIMLDIDHFKRVNDNYGHAVGDKVIQIFAKILQDAVEPNDIVGRYGGEEFVIVLANSNETQAIETAERIRATVNETRSDELPKGLLIASSFGVSSTFGDVWKADSLIDNADKCLYVAKENGRNRVVGYSTIDSSEEETKVTVEESTISRQREIKEIQKEENESVIKCTKLELLKDSLEFPLETYKMTEVLGRTVIIDRLAQAIKVAQRDDSTLTILTININTIKLISNIHGHASAEKLRGIAFERLINTFRSSDSITPGAKHRDIGLSSSAESEFIAILPNIELPTITTWIVNRMLEDLALPVEIDGNEIVMTATVGGSIYPSDGENPDKLLTNSSLALQKVSMENSGEFLFYNHDMNLVCKHEIEIESQLHQALQRDELYLDYQPIISMKTGEIDKFEALIRWKHPKLGLVAPDAFIDIAENTGIIKNMGTWIIKKACYQLKAWQMDSNPNLQMSINLSSIQFNESNLAENILDIVESIGVSPASIVFELTETVLLKNYDHIAETILKLDSAGFKIALDDFGTGYSSIDYLRKFPISFLKIDRSLMADFPNSVHDISIVSALISLAHDLGISIITEGVEEESQLVALRDLDCDHVQGYFISRPLSVQNATEFLNSTTTRQMMRKIKISKQILNESSNNVPLSDILNTPPSGMSSIS